MKKNWQSIFLFLLGINILNAQSIRYGFEQDADNPLRITAVAIPDFSSDNVTISTAVFSFTVTNSILLTPAIEVVPATGAFDSRNGNWAAQKITPQVYNSVGLDGADLQERDVYQVVLQNAPELTAIQEGQGIPLFSFELVDDCQEGGIEVLVNGGSIRNAVLRDLQANFNNQISVSINDAAAIDIYDEADPFSAQLECPLLLVSTHDQELVKPYLRVQPNPASEQTVVIVQSSLAGNGSLVLYDIQSREVIRQPTLFTKGINTIALDVTTLPSGEYLLVSTVKDLVLQTRFIKVDR